MMPTSHIQRWLRVSGILADISTTAWVTAREWGEIATELKDPEYAATTVPTNKNFRALRVAKNLLLRNSGTDDQIIVNIMNQRELGETNEAIFEFRRDALRQRKPLDIGTDVENVEGNEIPLDKLN
jgi:murein L,D-transpeptidase YcbB/YkuD